jgi:hypothetical protein
MICVAYGNYFETSGNDDNAHPVTDREFEPLRVSHFAFAWTSE